MAVVVSILLFVLAVIAEIGGAWLVWQGVREHRGLLWIGAGVIALGVDGFVAGSLAWGIVVDCFRPDRFDYHFAGTVAMIASRSRSSRCEPRSPQSRRDHRSLSSLWTSSGAAAKLRGRR